MSEFLCWSCGQPIRGSESTRKSVPEAERNAYEKADLRGRTVPRGLREEDSAQVLEEAAR